jgi:hypothetical protein
MTRPQAWCKGHASHPALECVTSGAPERAQEKVRFQPVRQFSNVETSSITNRQSTELGVAAVPAVSDLQPRSMNRPRGECPVAFVLSCWRDIRAVGPVDPRAEGPWQLRRRLDRD